MTRGKAGMSKPDLKAMTVNERLSTLGLMDQFDKAVFARDREAMLAIMRECEVERPEYTVDTVLANPVMYGYGPEEGAEKMDPGSSPG